MELEEYPEGYETDVKSKKHTAYDESAKSLSDLEKTEFSKYLFPYEEMRDSQKELTEDISNTLKTRMNFIAHAPTGLGKTIASIGPALEYCLRNRKTLFFLTSRHTQHIMAIKTLRDIKNKYDLNFDVLDLIGKKAMCLFDGIEALSNTDFTEFCKNAKKGRTCQYFNNTRKKDGSLKFNAEVFVDELRNTVQHTEEFVSSCEDARVCPYEISMVKSETAQVIISDYYYMFHPSIRKLFLNKAGLQLEDCVVIIDEAHNLPERIKKLATSQLSSFMLDRGLSETVKYGLDEASSFIRGMKEGLDFAKGAVENVDGEISRLVTKEKFNDLLNSITEPFEKITGELESSAEVIREKQKKTFVGGIADFITKWQGREEGFARIYTEGFKGKKLIYECLDPSIIAKEVFDNALSTIVISGTLEPTEMFRDLLGIKDCVMKSYENPFPKENALNLIVPLTTTKYTRRNETEFEKIAKECGKIINQVPGNSALFFPSYRLRDKVYKYLQDLSDKEFVLEQPGASKEEKAEIIKSFTRSSLSGKVLLGTSSGSFGEGIDLPGHFLTCVVVVGLPLKKPTLEIKELIKYYDTKFRRGWDYGYFYPSFNTTFQNIGRCIRSETDKGVMIYLDERFAEKRYLKYFGNRPKKISYAYMDKIKEFLEHGMYSKKKKGLIF